jgi:hypothetical protein
LTEHEPVTTSCLNCYKPLWLVGIKRANKLEYPSGSMFVCLFVCLYVCSSLLRFREKNRIKRFSERSNQYRVSQFTDFKKICKTQALSGSLSVSSFSLFVYFSFSLFMSLSVSVCLSLSLFMPLSGSLSVFLFLSLYVPLGLFLSLSIIHTLTQKIPFCQSVCLFRLKSNFL